MAHVAFTVTRRFDAPAARVWSALVDWPGHAEWIPMTRIELHDGPARDVPSAGPARVPVVGEEFTATSGLGPLALVDRMRVTQASAPQESPRRVRLDKIGPVLTGHADLQVSADGDQACTVLWVEAVTVPVLPQLLAPLLARGARLAFGQSLGSLAKQLRRTPAA